MSFAPAAGATVTIANAISDEAGFLAANPGYTPPAGFVAGSWGLAMNGQGTLVLDGASTLGSPLTINAGTVVVNGSITDPIVNAGGTLAGTGSVDATTVNFGGTLAPGPVGGVGVLTINGNLVFNAGSIYAVTVTPSAASSTTVNGAATLSGGTVRAVFGAGSYVPRSYNILHTSGGLTGTFAGLIGLPAGFSAQLSYSATDVSLDLTATMGALATGGLARNPQNVASALNGFFNNGGLLPGGFLPVFGLTGSSLVASLGQLSGETATGAQQAAFDTTGRFLDLMLDPFVDGRAGSGAPTLGFAAERNGWPREAAMAYAGITKAPPANGPSFEPGWSVWGTAFGGAGRFDGDAAVVGSHDLSARSAGVAAGADYRTTPSTIVGFALAGGGSSWSLAQGLGTGRSDAFMAGVHGRTSSGPAYVAASLAFANNWVSTDRTSFASDRLTAKFDAQSYGGRIETGYRIVTGFAAVTPYAAVTAQLFTGPAFSEADPSSGGFGLTYASHTATDTRAEFGSRFERPLALDPGTLLMLRGKLGYAHDWVSDPALTAAFQALPGASFVVTGAAPAHDSALASAGAELRFASGWALAAKFDGAFAAHTQTYGGTATARYTW
jgi:autotransporter-associated beta strand protein